MKRPSRETMAAAFVAIAVHAAVIYFFTTARDTSAAAGERTVSLPPGAPVRGALMEARADSARLLVRCYYDMTPGAPTGRAVWLTRLDTASSDAGYFARCPASVDGIEGELDPGVFSFNITIRPDSSVVDVSPTLLVPDNTQAAALSRQLRALRLWAPDEGRFSASNTMYLLRFTVPDDSYPNP